MILVHLAITIYHIISVNEESTPTSLINYLVFATLYNTRQEI